MHWQDLIKPDGRRLTLYAQVPSAPVTEAPSPFEQPPGSGPHLRWHPLRGEWIAYAAYRHHRSFLPPPDDNPLAPTTAAAHPTELPAGAWDVAVFDNRFPVLGGPAAEPPQLIVPTAPATGHCEVVVYSQNAEASLGSLPLSHLELLLQVWADRTERLARRGDIAWVLPFENRGAEVGATLHHPHGQIHGYPLLPPVPARMQHAALEHFRSTGVGLLQQHIAQEERAGVRMLYQGAHAVAFVPVCARHPYEVWVAPRQAVENFGQLGAPQRADLARALKTVLLKYDGLWQRPMPYVMAWFQAPTDGLPHPEAHLHAEFYPPCRTPDRLQVPAGAELAAGLQAMDVLPEDKARELQLVEVALD